MKKASLAIIIVFFLMTGTLEVKAYYAQSMILHKFKYLTDARIQYNNIHERMEKTIYLLEKEGNKAFNKISEMNTKSHIAGGIFIINPGNGEIILSPSEESIGNKALDNAKINGKAIVQEAIMKARNKLHDRNTFWRWFSSAPVALTHYYTGIAISSNGQLFVIAIGKNDLNMQRLFVTKLVKDACNLINEVGLKKSIGVFNRDNSYFRFKDTYIFIYGADKNNWGTCIYNPNYADDAGKNMIHLQNKYGYPIEAILKTATENGEGLIESTAHKPGETQTQAKIIYIRSIFIDGKTYVVGSGAYLSDQNYDK